MRSPNCVDLSPSVNSYTLSGERTIPMMSATGQDYSMFFKQWFNRPIQ
jgi:hypothetical protein